MSVSLRPLSQQFSSLSLTEPEVIDPKVSSLWLKLIKSQSFTHVPGNINDRLGHLGLTINIRGKGVYLITYGNEPLSVRVIHQSFRSDTIKEIPFQVTSEGFRCNSPLIVAEDVEQLVTKVRPHFGLCMSHEARPELDRAFVTLYGMKDRRLQRLLNRTLALSQLQLDESVIKRDCKFLQKVTALGYTTTVAHAHPERNRFSNVLPYDETRVTITGKPDFYLNASHVAMSHQNYVLCQAPTAYTLSDFWDGVIHTGATLVVSLDSQEKYWDIPCDKVQLIDTVQISENITCRTYSNDGKTITHLECTGWPDHSECPMELFTHILDVIDQHKSDSLSPIWVHCLAGRGRSGTTVVAHNSRLMVRNAKELGNSAETIFCNIRQEVALARMQREGVVEQSQLPMLYKVLIQEREKTLCPIT